MRRLFASLWLMGWLFAAPSAHAFEMSAAAERTLESMINQAGKIVLLPLKETSAPALSVSGFATIYADSVTHSLLVSENGGAYAALGVSLGVANTFTALQTFSAGILLGSDDTLAWGDAVGGGTADTWLSRISAGVLQHGLPDSSSPTAHVLTSQGYNNAVATAGPLFTIKGSNGGLTSGTGGELRLQGGLSGAAAGTGGAITFYTAPLAAGTTPALALTIDATKLATFTGQVFLPPGTSGAPSLRIGIYQSGFYSVDNAIFVSSNTVSAIVFNWDAAGQIKVGTSGMYAFGSTAAPTSSSDIALSRNSAGVLEVNSGTVGTFKELALDTLSQRGANGQKYVLGRKTELITVASGVLTQASTITIPANAILKAAEMRVTVQPGGTATVVATATTSATILQQGASMSTAAGTTDVGTRAWGTNYVGVAAQTVTFTFNGVTSDALGRIRLDLVYDEPTAPTS